MKYKVGDKVTYMELDMEVTSVNLFIDKDEFRNYRLKELIFLNGDNGTLASVYSDSLYLKLKENKNG
jgi:hypothetical protein